ncbi:hypothetical protein BH10CYA1_BH10CYA1_52920 [soil metagenome]
MRVLNCADSEERAHLIPFGVELGRDVVAQTDDKDPDLVDKRIADLSRYFSQYWNSLA